MRSKSCIQCQKIFPQPNNISLRIWNDSVRYCSRACVNIAKRGKRVSINTEFKKGNRPPTYSQTEKNCATCNKVIHVIKCRLKDKNYCSPRCHNKSSALKKRMTGSNNHKYKGDKVSYGGLHAWVKRELGKPKYCAKCKRTDRPYYDWANISREYKRELTDWARLCRPCHTKADKNNYDLTQYGSK